MKILNIYGQEYWHTDAKIMGNLDGLLALRDVVDRAIKLGEARTNDQFPIYASDGEGYTLIVECHNDDWGLEGGEDSFWNKKESEPEYTGLQE